MNDIKNKSETYREIRKRVWNEATFEPDPIQHEKNKQLLRQKIEDLCNKSDLSLYTGDSESVKRYIWNHIWTKIRYAGIKADIASREINDIKHIFDKYDEFYCKKWDIKIGRDAHNKKHILISGGDFIQDFLNREGVFHNKQTVGNLVKLDKTVRLARIYKEFVENSKNVPLNFITNGNDTNEAWEIHSYLQKIGYTSNLTALHLMMDLGFQVIKPDIVISRLFLALGWLHHIVPNLPTDLTAEDLDGKGKYKSKFQYTKPVIYKPIIELSKKIVKYTNKNDLNEDLGWSTNNPMREFDIFMVKFGQEPEKDWGLTKNLAKERGNGISKISKCPSKLGNANNET